MNISNLYTWDAPVHECLTEHASPNDLIESDVDANNKFVILLSSPKFIFKFIPMSKRFNRREKYYLVVSPI